mmetsp:Transcript_21487/g.66018  ORF Transcript_21487/g.66018 Transcript_21487/m.66018 type:complete len:215 (-) Transcript_21487:6-650(-)
MSAGQCWMQLWWGRALPICCRTNSSPAPSRKRRVWRRTCLRALSWRRPGPCTSTGTSAASPTFRSRRPSSATTSRARSSARATSTSRGAITSSPARTAFRRSPTRPPRVSIWRGQPLPRRQSGSSAASWTRSSSRRLLGPTSAGPPRDRRPSPRRRSLPRRNRRKSRPRKSPKNRPRARRPRNPRHGRSRHCLQGSCAWGRVIKKRDARPQQRP